MMAKLRFFHLSHVGRHVKHVLEGKKKKTAYWGVDIKGLLLVNFIECFAWKRNQKMLPHREQFESVVSQIQIHSFS